MDRMKIGIVQAIATFETGEISDNCQKLKIIIGNAKIVALIVKTKASLIAKISGKNENSLLKYHCKK